MKHIESKCYFFVVFQQIFSYHLRYEDQDYMLSTMFQLGPARMDLREESTNT